MSLAAFVSLAAFCDERPLKCRKTGLQFHKPDSQTPARMDYSPMKKDEALAGVLCFIFNMYRYLCM